MNQSCSLRRVAQITALFSALSFGPMVRAQGGPDQKILFSVCNYCIETKELKIPLKNGSARDLSWRSFVRGGAVLPQGHFGNPDKPMISGGVIIASAGGLKLGLDDGQLFVLAPDMEVAPFIFDFDGMGTVAIPHILTRDGEKFGKKVQTASVCIGSQFKAPSYYFVAPDKKPMAVVPYAAMRLSFTPGIPPAPLGHSVAASAFAMEFPPDGPTLCEGELIPANTFFKDYAEKQIVAALNDFRERGNDAAIRKIVEETTQRQITERFDELAALAANVVAERAVKSPATLAKRPAKITNKK